MSSERTQIQGRYWIATVPVHLYMPFLPPGVSYVAGQIEVGATTGYKHWQLCIYYAKKIRLSRIKNDFGESAHFELSRSEAVEEYCKKSETGVDGTWFELGKRSIKRNSPEDWDKIWESAKQGKIEDIPADIRVRSYHAITKIQKDYLSPSAEERTVWVFWGKTGTGKSRRAWAEAGWTAYPKDPNTKFWDGYRGQENVVMDEFRGKIDISNILRWTDRYPVSVETKGSGVVFAAKNIWITSNLHPRDWYPELDRETLAALLRRLNIIEILLITV
jgi:hypothetical protein